MAGALASTGSCGPGRGASGGPVGDGGDGAVADLVDPRTSLCGRYGSVDGSLATFDTVQQIFDDNCTACHTQGAPLDLSRGLAYANIVDHQAPSSESCGGILVTPGDPAASYLYQKLIDAHPCVGSQMPLSELFSSIPLPTCVTAIIRTWIEAGAQPPATDAGQDRGP